MAKIDLKKVNMILPYPINIFTLLFVIILSFFVFFSIIPGYRSIQKIRQDIKMIGADLGVSEKIVPAFTKAKKIDEIEFKPSFLFPNRERLDRNKLPILLNKFQSIALKHNLRLTGNKFDTDFLKKQSDSVSILLILNGRLPDLRKFLVSIISLPFFEKIETISIQPGENDLKFFNINFKIFVETNHE